MGAVILAGVVYATRGSRDAARSAPHPVPVPARAD